MTNTQTDSSARHHLALIAQKKQQRAGELFDAALRKKRFEYGAISSTWKQMAKKALSIVPPVGVKVSVYDYASVLEYDFEGKQEPNLFQFGVMSNAIEYCSLEKLGFGDDFKGYCEFVKEFGAHVKTWNERVETVRKEIEQAVEKEFAAKVNALQKDQKDPLKVLSE